MFCSLYSAVLIVMRLRMGIAEIWGALGRGNVISGPSFNPGSRS